MHYRYDSDVVRIQDTSIDDRAQAAASWLPLSRWSRSRFEIANESAMRDALPVARQAWLGGANFERKSREAHAKTWFGNSVDLVLNAYVD